MMKVSDKYLLDMFRKSVGTRAEWECESPGCHVTGDNLHPHHVFSVEHKSIRYDAEYNGVWLCYSCHRYAHQKPENFISLLIDSGVRTQEWFEELIKRKNIIVKFNNDYRIKQKELLGE